GRRNQVRRAPLRVDAGDVLHVVAVGFEEAHHRIFGVEQEALRIVRAGVERPVVADLGRAAGTRIDRAGVALRAAAVQAAAAVLVVRLPRRIRSLEHDVGLARIVTDDERNVARPAGIGAGQLRDVDAGGGSGRRAPRGRDRPDAAIGEAGHAIDVARRLRLRARVDQRRHLPRTRATVVAETVDVDVVAGRGRFDLEGD